MRITKLGHSCLLVEDGLTRVIIDPGKYSFKENSKKPEDIEGLNGILITHEHFDHADPAIIKKLLEKNDAVVYGNSGVKSALKKAGIEAELLDDRIAKIGGMQIEAISSEHDALLSGIPLNTAFFINNTLLVTGDSLDAKLAKFKPRILAIPVLAPWMNQRQGAEFLKAMLPEIAIPVHDGFVDEDFRKGQHLTFQKYAETLGVHFVIPEEGKTMQF